MLYYVLKILYQLFYRTYYKVEIRYEAEIATGVPVVLAPNHVNAFIDPTIIATWIRRKVRFFARGDVFRTSAFGRWALESMNISPIYRIQEGYADLKKNDATFEESKQRLLRGEALLIFPEAVCEQVPKVRKLKKGLARIVFGVYEESALRRNVLIYPVGLNYWEPARFGSKLLIVVGNPLSLEDYTARYKENKADTLRQFTADLEKAMKAITICVEEETLYPVYQRLISRVSGHPVNKGKWERGMYGEYRGLMEFSGALNHGFVSDPEMVSALAEETREMAEGLNKGNINRHWMSGSHQENPSVSHLLFCSLLLVLSLPFFLFGWFSGGMVFDFAYRRAKKKVRKIEFHASVHAMMGMLFWFAYYAIGITLIAVLAPHYIWSLLYVVAAPISLLTMAPFLNAWRSISSAWKLRRLLRSKHAEAERIRGLREKITGRIASLINAYRNVQIPGRN
ncbi:MAG: 1-acyl-sn-glycerol-3-phosphate acyltransferase [Bacteroidia bacterium]|nr:1-acyl-sn-glycerol-3-phosphate acyltransferase [Bacteroidia bacterium]